MTFIQFRNFPAFWKATSRPRKPSRTARHWLRSPCAPTVWVIRALLGGVRTRRSESVLVDLNYLTIIILYHT